MGLVSPEFSDLSLSVTLTIDTANLPRHQVVGLSLAATKQPRSNIPGRF